MASAIVFAIGCLGLLRWILSVQLLDNVAPGLTVLKPNLALGLILCGIALGLLSQQNGPKWPRHFAAAFSLAALLLGAITLIENVSDWDFGINRWLLHGVPGIETIPHPGRLSPATGFCFFVMGGVLLRASSWRSTRFRLPLVAGGSASVMIIGALALAGFVLETLLGRSWNYMGMNTSGVLSAIGFMLLGSGVLALARREGGLIWSLDGPTTAGFVVGILLTVVAASVAFNFSKQMLETTKSLSHRQEVLKKTEEVSTDMGELLSQQRLYVILGEENFLQGREQTEKEVDADIHDLRGLIEDNPNQRRRLDQLQPLVRQRVDWEDKLIAIRREQGFSAAAQLIGNGPGLGQSEQILHGLTEMQEDEYRLLEADRKQAEAASTAAFLLLPLALFLSLAVLCLGVFFLNGGLGERARAEMALREREAQLHTIVENLDEGVVVSDLDGRLLQWNRAALRLHGYSESGQDRRRFTELVDTFELFTLEGAPVPVEQWPLARILRGERVHDLELRLRRMGSEWERVFHYDGNLVHDANKQPLMAIVTIGDITEPNRAEEMLRSSEERYRTLFESNPNPMWVFDVETLRFLAVNAAAVRHYGYSHDEFLAMTIKDIRPPHDIPALMDNLSHQLGGLDDTAQWRHRKKNGALIDVEITSHNLMWLGREASLVLINDITTRKLADDRLREQADIINRAHDAVIVRDFTTDRVIVWNSGAERLYGWSASEAIGRPMGELIFIESNNREALLEQLVSTGEFHGEIKHCAKDGHEVIVNSRTTLVTDDDGTPRSVLGINTDITERKRLETQLLRAQRLESIGTLASGVAHDLNNVLTPILMCADLLRGDVTTQDAQSSLSLIEKSAQRGAAIVKQVLTFARGIEGERVILNPIHLIDEIMDIAQRTFPKSIEITSRYSEDVWTIEGDPTQLHQVLLNLSVNARDAMSNGGSLVFAAENFTVDDHYASMRPDAKPGPYLILQVSDSGLGMPQSTIDKIFDPFFTTKEIGKGTGLGLSTSLGIVKSHGGFISVYSEIKAGTTFKIFLPAQLSEAAMHGASIAPETLSGNGELVLVVDDEPAILVVTGKILEQHNYRILAANDGPEALGMIAEQNNGIGLVLTDISMPFMDGVALIRTIKKMRPTMPFIASTGQGEQGRLSELQSLGVQTFLTKPYNKDSLLRTLRDVLSVQPCQA